MTTTQHPVQIGNVADLDGVFLVNPAGDLSGRSGEVLVRGGRVAGCSSCGVPRDRHTDALEELLAVISEGFAHESTTTRTAALVALQLLHLRRGLSPQVWGESMPNRGGGAPTGTRAGKPAVTLGGAAE